MQSRVNEAKAKEQEVQATARTPMRGVLGFLEDRVLAAARPEGRPGGLGRAVTLRQAIDAALPAVAQDFAAQPLVEVRLRQTLGTSYYHLGDAARAAEQFEASRAFMNGTAARTTPTHSRAWTTWPAATMPWAGTPRPSSSTSRR